MNRIYCIPFLFLVFILGGLSAVGFCQVEKSPLEFLREQEIKSKGANGESYLGKILTITFATAEIDVDERYFPFFTELADLLKSPLRRSYRLVLKGYSDNSGSAVENMKLSVKRVENLKALFVDEFLLEEGRIKTKGLGETDPASSNETEIGRRNNRRVEIHVYGDVSEAVRFIEKQEARQ